MKNLCTALMGLAVATSLVATGQESPSSPLFIVETMSDRDLYVYDEDWNEERMSADEFRKSFESRDELDPDAEYMGDYESGIKVQKVDDAEGVYQVVLRDGRTVWIETIAVDVAPDREMQMQCLESITSVAQEAERDGTVGFGGCEKDEQEQEQQE